MKFEVGDFVFFFPNRGRGGYNAPDGAKAVVVGTDDRPYLTVKWLADYKQGDGGYYPSDFRLVRDLPLVEDIL